MKEQCWSNQLKFQTGLPWSGKSRKIQKLRDPVVLILIIYRLLTEVNSRYYGLSLMRGY